VEFSRHIVQWYYENQRNLPWRATKEPYKIWLSEIILQQTRVAQGLSYYESFITNFPNIESLALAEEQEVLKLWQGLGYYSRARNLHYTAKHIHFDLKGEFPRNYKDLLKLKGVGDYTASAISSIAYDEAQAVVDGNVYRVLSRVFNIKTPINSTKGNKEFRQLAQELIDENNAGDHNQALMEMGATICTAKKPMCSDCVLEHMCLGKDKDLIAQLPVKEKTLKVRNRYIEYYCIEHEGRLFLKKRTAKDIWQNLYDFPGQEATKEIHANKSINLGDISKFLGIKISKVVHTDSFKHKLSHQNLHINICHLLSDQEPKLDELVAVNFDEIDNYPVPKPIETFLNKVLN